MHFQDQDELLFSGFQYLQRFLESMQEASKTVLGKSYERIIGFSLANAASAFASQPVACTNAIRAPNAKFDGFSTPMMPGAFTRGARCGMKPPPVSMRRRFCDPTPAPPVPS